METWITPKLFNVRIYNKELSDLIKKEKFEIGIRFFCQRYNGGSKSLLEIHGDKSRILDGVEKPRSFNNILTKEQKVKLLEDNVASEELISFLQYLDTNLGKDYGEILFRGSPGDRLETFEDCGNDLMTEELCMTTNPHIALNFSRGDPMIFTGYKREFHSLGNRGGASYITPLGRDAALNNNYSKESKKVSRESVDRIFKINLSN